MKQFWIALALAVAALAISALLIGGRTLFGHAPDTPGAQAPTLPWQIDTLPDGGSKVMGLKLGHGAQASTLADARQRWGQDMQVAIIAAPGENGTLEAFVDPAQAGFISGKLVITAQLPADIIQGMRERALKGEFMESTTRKFVLSPEDMKQALSAPITAMSFIPQANLDEDMIVARFGKPAERVRSNGHLEHFLYPDKGLDLALDSQGKELLQYVAPADFNRLRQPLKTAL
jgi:hypothetical protein